MEHGWQVVFKRKLNMRSKGVLEIRIRLWHKCVWSLHNACVLLTLVCLWPVLLVTSVHKNHCAWFAKANESSLNSSVWCSLPSLVLVLEQAADSKLQNYTGHPDTRMMKSNFQKQEEDAVSTSKTNQLQHGKDDSLSDVALEDAEFMR